MFTYPTFDVQIIRQVDPKQLQWPRPGEADDESGLGCNREYLDLRGSSWAEAETVYTLEQTLIARIESAVDSEKEYETIEDELFDSDQGLYGLDLGIASVVVALSAARCLPFSSCNGGAFGGAHHEAYPLVAFYARIQTVKLLIASAEEADIGLQGGAYVVAYANDVRKMRAFAESIIRRRPQFAALRRQRSPRTRRNENEELQYELPLE